VPLGFADGVMAVGEIAEIDAILGFRHELAPGLVNLMIAIGLRVLVDVVLCHTRPPPEWGCGLTVGFTRAAGAG